MGTAAVPVFFGTDDAGFDQLWHRATAGQIQPLTISLLGRQLQIPDAGNACAKASFAYLCDTALGPADYRRLMQSVRMLFLDDVPLLGAGAQDKIRRFVTLIDEAYEARIGLVMRSAAAPDALIAADMQSSGTTRLTSRLAQMQSDSWVGAYVLPAVALPAAQGTRA
jgi:cell division protein ZapE